MRNQQLKRPNTIANKHIHNTAGGSISNKLQGGSGQHFDINGIRYNGEKDNNNNNGTIKISTLTNAMDRSNGANRGNVNELFDKIDKFGNPNIRAQNNN